MTELQILKIIILYLLFIFSIILSFYFLYDVKKQKKSKISKFKIKNSILFFIISLLIGVFFSLLFYKNFFLLLLALIISILSYIASFYYSNKFNIFIYCFILLVLVLFYSLFINSLIIFLQLFSIITILGFIRKNLDYKLYIKSKKMIGNNDLNLKVELNRDIFQMMLGVLIIIILFYIKNSFLLITLLALLGYFLINFISFDFKLNNQLLKILKYLERSDVIYGSGAIYAICSLLLIFGFISNKFLVLGVIILFFADPIATITGISFNKIKLFYNKNKTLVGSSGFFIVIFIFSLMLNFTLFYALIISLIFSFIESLKIEDNISLAIAIIVLSSVVLIL